MNKRSSKPRSVCRITDEAHDGQPGRVYVVDCRHLCAEPPMFSRTREKRKASLFMLEEARALVSEKPWRRSWQIEEVN